ncbi:MAG: iron complex outermembrane receptor protein [Myxococcota bacterium]|jgi:iron complex outermembrane receptor protein
MPLPPPPPPLPEFDIVEVLVEEDAPIDAAAARTLDRTDLSARPARSAEDWLRATPGLHLASHGGRGKPQQLLVRGFDAEHGTSFAVDIEGAPMNEWSNLHGNGYVDLAFLPPSVVRGLAVRAGTPRPMDGAFAIAGSASYSVGLDQRGLALTAGGGSDGSGEAALAWRPRKAEAGSFLVAEAGGGTGGAPGREFHLARGGGGVQHTEGPSELQAFVLGGVTAFTNPGVLRPEEHAADPYAAHPHAGGGLSRKILSVSRWTLITERLTADTTAWAGWRDLDLDQSFTGFTVHPKRGDATHQDQRTVGAGARSRVALRVADPLWWRAGGELRHDSGDSREASVGRSGDEWGVPDASRWGASEAAAWTELAATAGPVEFTPGVRASATALDLPGGSLPGHSIGPSGRAVVHLGSDAALLASAGRGYAPATAQAPGTGAPTQSTSAEVGVRVAPGTVDIRLTAFGARVSDEPIFDHTAGRAIAAGDTERRGVAAVASWQPVEAIRVDTDLTAVDARRPDTGEPVPYAPRWIGGVGVSLLHLHAGRGHLTAGLWGRAVGPRPLPLGLATAPVATADATATLDFSAWSVGLSAENLAGRHWQEGAFVFTSRQSPDAPDTHRPVAHIAAGQPRAVRGTVTWRL